MRYAYYPGCTQEGTAREYDRSVREVCRALGIELVEIPGWSCCGASSGHATDYWLSHALAGRNLALAERAGLDIAVACPACFLRLRNTRQESQREARLQSRLPSLINMPYEARYDVRHLLELICNTVGTERVRERVTQPLLGLRLVAYYGCYLVRPPELTGFDDPENPQTMDRLLASLGAEVLDWGGKVDCCGGSLSLTNREVVTGLVAGICQAAREVEAEALVTACPLCQANLEARQTGSNRLPVFFFTELMGLALGCDAQPWLRRHLLSPFGLLRKHGLC
ncbi:MAG: CoB--CoM heterodisulfide reductase iron-sulfur subunit B family protein [Chloroflexota bacterium]